MRKKGKRILAAFLSVVMALTIFGAQPMEASASSGQAVGPDDDYGYLMVHFIEDSGGYAEKIYLDISRGDNPQQWDPLNGGRPILASNMGTTGVRDPFITYSPESELYYIIGTDLRVFGADNAGWTAWQNNYSTKMNVWSSRDLIHWGEMAQFDVALNAAGEKQANMGMMWAPEATWVDDYYGKGDGAFVVYWSSQCYKDAAQTEKDSGSKIMWGATKDFTQKTWEFGGVFLDGGQEGWIDTTILQNGDTTYHITKSNKEQIIMESTKDKEWWKEGASWKRIQSEIGKSRFGSVEGPATFKDHTNDNAWYLFVDDLPSPGYQPMYSNDLDKGWDYLDSKDYYLTKFTKHGGVISLKKAQYDALRGADAVSVAKQPEQVRAAVGSSEQDILNSLPAKVSVNLAYDMGTAELPVEWDLSGVQTDKAGRYQAVGVIDSIGANKNDWIGYNGATDYLAANKKLRSMTELKTTAQICLTTHTQDGADVTFLNQAIAKANALNEADYTAESWRKLQKAVQDGAAAAGKENAKQAELDAAEQIIEDAIAALCPASILAYYDFNDSPSGAQFVSGDVTAELKGAKTETAKLEERDAENGKAIYFDGSDCYLDLKKSGGSVLTGLSDVTISFDAKPDRIGTNWAFFAAPNANQQTNTKEHYIGALIKDGRTTIERYNNNGARPTNPAAETGSGWSHVDVVLNGNTTTIYVDGEKSARQESAYALEAILGQNSIFQIGKANWGNGEYYKGWLDNFAIYGAALSDEKLIDAQKASIYVAQAARDLFVAEQSASDFKLPVQGSHFVSVAWTVKEPNGFLSIEGDQAKVTRPAKGQPDQTVTLVATATLGSASRTKEFAVTIPAVTAEDARAKIVIPKYITGDLQSEIDGEKIRWTAEPAGSVSEDGKVTLPAAGKGSQSVRLTASVGGDVTVTGDVELVENGGSILTYVLKETDLLAYKDSRRTDALFAAVQKDDGTYENFNKGKAILYVKWDGDQKTNADKQMGSPSFFRKADGSLGVVASANNNEEGVYLWDITDAMTFANQRYIKLNGSKHAVQNPMILFDSASGSYKVFWESGGASYMTTMANLTDAPGADATTTCSYPRTKAAGQLPDNADEAQASLFVVSKAERDALVKKYGKLYNTGVAAVSVTAKAGDEVTLPETVTAQYSDGSKKSLGVKWDEAALASLKEKGVGTYTVEGTVQQDAYAYPFIEERADPHVFYNEDDGYYYSTGSYYEENMQSCNVAQSYRKLDLRRAKTIEGLKTAKEHYLMESAVGDRWGGFFWAPEFHKINGTWYCLVGAHDFGTGGITAGTNWNASNWCSRSILIPYVGDGDAGTAIEEDIKAGGMLEASQWGEPIILNLPSNANASFDVSYYRAKDGQGYYIIPRSANLFIVKAKSGEGEVPQPDGSAVNLKGLEWPWEYGVQEGSVNAGNPEGTDQGIVEGPYLFEFGDKVYISYSGATVDKYYCLGLMMADQGSDLMDPASWTHVPYPVLSSYDTYEGAIGGGAHVGGGHNSIVRDEYGNLALIYHARPYPDPHEGQSGAGGLFDPCRHTVVKSVNVAYDGTLVFNMTADEELDPKFKKIRASVTLTKDGKPIVEVTSVRLDADKISLKVGEKKTLRATVEPQGATDPDIAWKTSDAKIADVKDGVVTAVAAGTATITAQSSNGKKAECTVTVTKADGGKEPGAENPPVIAVKKIKLNKEKVTLGVKEKFTIKATVTPENATDKTPKYQTSNRNVAQVSPKGVVTAKRTGKATITVTVGGQRKKCQITVKKAPGRIALNAKKKTLKKGGTFQIKVKLPKNTASYSMTYKTSNKKVATVSSAGKIKAKKKGKATITVQTFNKKKAKIAVRVK